MQYQTQKDSCVDANNLYGWAMSQSLLYDEIMFDTNVKLKNIIINSDDSDMAFLLKVIYLILLIQNGKQRISIFVLKLNLHIKVKLVIK